MRQDNADLRLRNKGYEAGLVTEEEMQRLKDKEDLILKEIKRVSSVNVGPQTDNLSDILSENGSTYIEGGTTMAELIRRPELSYDILEGADPMRPELPADVREQVNIQIKYDGYIKRQKAQVEKFKKLENKIIPADIKYTEVYGLRTEAAQKLEKNRPRSIGQASRISGVSPADISVLMIALEQSSRKEN